MAAKTNERFEAKYREVLDARKRVDELRDMLKYAEVRLRDAERDAAYLFEAEPDTPSGSD